MEIVDMRRSWMEARSWRVRTVNSYRVKHGGMRLIAGKIRKRANQVQRRPYHPRSQRIFLRAPRTAENDTCFGLGVLEVEVDSDGGSVEESVEFEA